MILILQHLSDQLPVLPFFGREDVKIPRHARDRGLATHLQVHR